jgi:hypothetical protein
MSLYSATLEELQMATDIQKIKGKFKIGPPIVMIEPSDTSDIEHLAPKPEKLKEFEHSLSAFFGVPTAKLVKDKHLPQPGPQPECCCCGTADYIHQESRWDDVYLL